MSMPDERPSFIVIDIGADHPVKRCKRIKYAIAAGHGLTVEDLEGPVLKRRVSVPRHSAMAAVAVANPHWSLRQIGRRFGMRDHTTVLSALKKMGVRQ
jgi:chromosomal replication initiator protein